MENNFLQQNNRPYSYSKGELISIYLYGELQNPGDYINNIEAIRNANENDDIFIYFNTPGGDMNIAIAFLTAMAQSKAFITGIIDGECSSAGTPIFLACHAYEISPYSCMLIHTYSSGYFGKSHEITAQAIFCRKFYSDIFSSVYTGFLTEDEISKVANGQDIWLAAEEVAQRCQDLIAYKSKESISEEISGETLEDSQTTKS